MKSAATIVLTSMAILASGSTLAFRDESQSVLIWRAMQAKRAEQLAKAKQEQTGVAGPTAVPGKVGPSTQTSKNRRDPTDHP
jgi:hypothetical protein